MIRHANNADIDFLAEHDRHLSTEVIRKKIADGMIYIIESESGEIAGWLRFGMFWDEIPFMNMLYVLEPHRGKGFGRQMVERWENDMRLQGFGMVLTSTLSDESAQNFYRKLGYADTGVLLLPSESAEIILRKQLG